MRLVGAGFMVEYFDSAEPPTTSSAPVEAGLAHAARIMWIGPPRPGLAAGACAVRIRGSFTPDVSGAWRLGLESAGRSLLRLDGDVLIDNTDPSRGPGFYGAGSEPVEVTVDLAAGTHLRARRRGLAPVGVLPHPRARIGASPPDTGDEFERAVRAAAEADVSVVVVGSNGEWESEGHDRPDLSLPGRQRELIEAVLAANPRTIVVVNAGSPVEMPWADERRRRPHGLVPRRGGGRCPGRRHHRRLRALGTPAGHLPGPGGGRAGGSRHGG